MRPNKFKRDGGVYKCQTFGTIHHERLFNNGIFSHLEIFGKSTSALFRSIAYPAALIKRRIGVQLAFNPPSRAVSWDKGSAYTGY